MRILVTGSAGHLGEALMRTLRAQGREAVGLDVIASSQTDEVGSIGDRAFVDRALDGVQAVVHTASLHKPHLGTHARQQFVDTNITGTLNLLEAAAANQRCRIREAMSAATCSGSSQFGQCPVSS